MQPDTIVSDPYNPQAWNRYAYVLNNPIRYNDPTGHEVCWEGSEPGGRCLDAAGFIKNDLESDYNIKITGGWDKDELLLLTTSLNKLAAYAGGADNLNDIFQDALKNNNVNSDRLVFSNQKQENCPGDDAQACWRYWEGTVSFSDAVFSGQYQFRPGAFRPVELGLKGNLEASIQVTMIHEMVHVFADARPPAAKIYSWRVPIPGTDSEERMANTIAFYVVSGKQNWPGRPNHFDFVRDITALWQATP